MSIGRKVIPNDSYIYDLNKSLEVKSTLLRVLILGELISEEGYQSGCMIKELDANECRLGCPICHLNAKARHIKKIFPNAKEGPGE